MDELIKFLRGLGKKDEETFEEKKAKSKLKSPLFEGETPNVLPEPVKRTMTIPTDQGFEVVPEDISNRLFDIFEESKLATPAAEVLKHPMMDTSKPGEKINWNIGENPKFDLYAQDEPAAEGTTDRGFMRINSKTFEDMLSGKGKDKEGNDIDWTHWKDKANAEGIYDWEDMKDPVLNLRMARLIVEREGYNEDTGPFSPWYAAPLKYRLPWQN